MKTITYNPETHVLVPREPNPNWCAGCSPDNCSGCGAEPVESEPAVNECRLTLIHQIHELADHIERAAPSVTDSDMRKQMLGQREYALKVSAKWNMNGNPFSPQPDRTAELEQLRQQVADLEKERDELIEVKAAENASWNAGFNVQVDQLKKLTAERDAALNEARDFEYDVDTVTQHNVELQLETITLKSALNAARDALIDCEGALDECRDYPITYDTILEALAKINEVLHD